MKIVVISLWLISQQNIQIQAHLELDYEPGKLTVKGTKCIFPFIYRGVSYTDCAPRVSQPSPWAWCATRLQENREAEEWDVCVSDSDTKSDDGVCELLCEFLDEEECRKNIIKKLCPKLCLEEIDEEVCQYLDKEQCRKESIKKRCPQFCSEAVCIPKCINGKCTDDNVCACNKGWAGDACEIAECNPKCINGVCMEESLCRCTDGWIGQACDISKCNPRCINGLCNDDNRCTCHDGYSGAACDISCPAGYFKLPGGRQCFRRFGRKVMHWKEAKSLCAAEGGFLAKPDDPAALAHYMMDSPNGGTSWSWIGAHGTGSSTQWDRDGTTLEKSNPHWWPKRASIADATKNCLALFVYDNYLSTPYHDAGCNRHQHVPLCEVPMN